jgi:hypothetical protein
MKSIRAASREQMNERLLPELRRLGFQGPSRIGGNRLLHELRRAGPRGTDVLTIQLEKYGLPRFVLGLHVEPPQGIEAVIARGGTVIAGSARPRKGPSTRHWFRADASLWQRLRGSGRTYEREAVDACIALLPEIEAWWAVQQPTKHIAAWPVTYAASRDRDEAPPGAHADGPASDGPTA